jgi:hypothetical protein
VTYDTASEMMLRPSSADGDIKSMKTLGDGIIKITY